jgi:hypothetical protein
MRFDLLITDIGNPRARPVLAHHIARNLNIPLQKAISSLESLPVVYANDMSLKQVEEYIAQLTKLGVRTKKIETVVETFIPQPSSPGQNPVFYNEGVPGVDPRPGLAARSEPEHPPQAQTAEKHAEMKSMPVAKPARQPAPATPPQKPEPVQPALRNEARRQKLIARIKAILWTIAVIGLMVGAYFVSCHNIRFGLNFGSRILPGGVDSVTSKNSTDDGTSILDSLVAADTLLAAILGDDSLLQAQRGLSRSIADAADSMSDPEAAEPLYRRAVDVNGRNLRAWQGLMTGKRQTGEKEQAEGIRQTMKRIFGEKVFPFCEAISHWGKPLDLVSRDTSACAIEYRSQRKGTAVLIEETYRLIAAVHTICGCEAFGVVARASDGSGLRVAVRLDPFPVNLSEYERTAAFTVLKSPR